MIERHKKFLEYMKGSFPDLINDRLVNLTEEEIVAMYSRRVYALLFDSTGKKLAPLNINSGNVWLRLAALFRLSNPI